jgi:hypothetical protein
MPYRTRLELDSLGWKAFQDLCGTILRVVLGQTVQEFAPTHDGGRDLSFFGKWAPQQGETIQGPFVVQCKFVTTRSTLTVSNLTAELPKIRRLVETGLCSTYVVMTNASVSAETDRRANALLANEGVQHTLIMGREQLEAYILESPRLRSVVPRLYGLGDLSEILDERAYVQAQAILDWLKLDLITFVATETYSRAEHSLEASGLLLLVGPPGVGKSTIGAVLAIASGDEGFRALKLDSASQFVQHWNPLEPKQFFWIDDPFGSTQIDPARVDEWNHVLPEIQAAITRGARFVLVSRDYIWNDARTLLRRSRLPLLSDCVIDVDVANLSIIEKRQIVYNHLKYGSQPAEFRAAVKPHLPAAAAVEHFLPEVARRFGNPMFTRGLRPDPPLRIGNALIKRGLSYDRHSITGFFSHPLDHLTEVIEALPDRDKAALAIVYMAVRTRHDADQRT